MNILEFGSGVIAISDWRIHNYIRKDRYTESSCIKEKSQIKIDGAGRYSVG